MVAEGHDILPEDELDDTLGLLEDLEQLVASGRVVVDVDEDLPPRFRPLGLFERAARDLGGRGQRDDLFDPRD